MIRFWFIVIRSYFLFFCLNNVHAFQEDTKPKESVYVHLDKDIYLASDQVCFSATIFDYKSLTPTTASKLLYVSLVDLNKTVIESKKFLITHGKATGRIQLPSNLGPGTYFISAMTIHSQIEFDKVTPFEVVHDYTPRYLLSHQFQVDHKKEHIIGDFQVKDYQLKIIENLKIKAVYSKNDGSRRVLHTTTDSKGTFKLKFRKYKNINLNNISISISENAIGSKYTISLPQPSDHKYQIGVYPHYGNITDSLRQDVFIEVTNSWGKAYQGWIKVIHENKKIEKIASNEYGIAKVIVPSIENINLSFQIDEFQTEFQNIISKEYRFSDYVLTEESVVIKLNSIPKKNECISCRAEVFNRGQLIYTKKFESHEDNYELEIPISLLVSPLLYMRMTDDNGHNYGYDFQIVSSDFYEDFLITSKIKSGIKTRENIKVKLDVDRKSSYNEMILFNAKTARINDIRLTNKLSLKDHFLISSDINKPIELLNPQWITILREEDYFIDRTDNVIKNKIRTEDILVKSLIKSKKYGWDIFPKAEIDILTSSSLAFVTTDSLGYSRFKLDDLLYFEKERVLINRFPTANTKIEIYDFINEIPEILNNSLFDIHSLHHKTINSSIQRDLEIYTFLENNNQLDAVDLYDKSTKKQKNNTVHARQGDYVCFEYDYLNCMNHRYGYAPENGMVYNSQSGLILYKTPVQSEASFYDIEMLQKDEETFYDNDGRSYLSNSFLDLRSTIFWTSRQLSTQNGKIELEFTTPHLKGDYKTIIEWYTSDGKLGSKEFLITVK